MPLFLFFFTPLNGPEQEPAGQIFKVKTGWACKKPRHGGGVATSVGGWAEGEGVAAAVETSLDTATPTPVHTGDTRLANVQPQPPHA